MDIDIALITHVFSCFFMTGVIWTIQVVHYPSFSFAREQFGQFHKFHSNRITWIVLPAMSVELISAIALVYFDPSTFWISNLGGVLIIWGATAALSVPQHGKLAAGFDPIATKRLTLTNWVRTITWTVRSSLLAILLYKFHTIMN